MVKYQGNIYEIMSRKSGSGGKKGGYELQLVSDRRQKPLFVTIETGKKSFTLAGDERVSAVATELHRNLDDVLARDDVIELLPSLEPLRRQIRKDRGEGLAAPAAAAHEATDVQEYYLPEDGDPGGFSLDLPDGRFISAKYGDDRRPYREFVEVDPFRRTVLIRSINSDGVQQSAAQGTLRTEEELREGRVANDQTLYLLLQAIIALNDYNRIPKSSRDEKASARARYMAAREAYHSNNDVNYGGKKRKTRKRGKPKRSRRRTVRARKRKTRRRASNKN